MKLEFGRTHTQKEGEKKKLVNFKSSTNRLLIEAEKKIRKNEMVIFTKKLKSSCANEEN